MGLFSLFNKTQSGGTDTPEYYQVDFHSHLIPGIDDGSKSYEESAEIISIFKKLGVRKMITTPHISMDYYPNKETDILNRFQLLKTEMTNAGMDMELEVAAEYMIDDAFRKKMEAGNLLTFGKKYILVELSGFQEHPDFSPLIFDLQSTGFDVILAHPERYSFYQSDRKKYTILKERDVIFQMNALSLTNIYSKEVNKTAQWLIDNKMIDFIGSDVHHAHQKHNYIKALSSTLYRKLQKTNSVKNNSLL